MTMRLPTTDPARIAAELRRCIAQHDEARRTRCALIQALDDYAHRLKLENLVAARLVGRLRRGAAHYEADAERARRRRRVFIPAKTCMREAA